MTGKTLKTRAGAILYDAQQVSQPDPAWFDPGYWQQRDAVERIAGGRGSALVVKAPTGEDGSVRWVLRHYLRGGAVARFLGDRYLYTGADRTRAFREFRVLIELRDLGLPVPKPIAARFQRRGLWYRADLLTGYLPGTDTLSHLATRRREAVPWQRVGHCIAGFHQHGLCHADLNAHNILVADSEVSLIDFDRASFRAAGHWRQENLARLKRSLIKEGALDGKLADRQPQWLDLIEGYKQPR